MSEITRKIVREVRPKLAEAVRRGDYEAFKEILSLAGIPLGSDEFRSYEAQFWRAVSEYRKSRQQSP